MEPPFSQNSGQPEWHYCVAQNQYGKYCVPLSSRHRPAAQKILSGEAYEPRTIEFITSHIGDGDVVHAGAYFGDFLPAIARACAPRAQVWSFEPNRENFCCAAKTCQINELKNVELCNAALGTEAGHGWLLTADQTGRALGGGSRVIASGSRSAARHVEKIQIVAIDDVVAPSRPVSIIHLDVEGQEKEALSGAQQTIQRCLPILILETLPDQDWLSINLFPLGYQVGQRLDGNTVLPPRRN